MREAFRPYSADTEQSIPPPTTIGEKIIAQRDFLGLSQAELSEVSGVSQGYLSQLENNEYENIGYKIAISLASSFGVGMNFFEGKHDDKVFLKFPARRLFQIISSPTMPTNNVNAINSSIEKLIPQCEGIALRYISVGERINLGRSLRKAREEKRLLQKQLSAKTGLSQPYISQVETREDKAPSLRTVKALSEALNLDLSEILEIEEKEYPQSVVHLDRFLRSAEFTIEQKHLILNRLIQVISMIQPLVNRIDPLPQEISIR